MLRIITSTLQCQNVFSIQKTYLVNLNLKRTLFVRKTFTHNCQCSSYNFLTKSGKHKKLYYRLKSNLSVNSIYKELPTSHKKDLWRLLTLARPEKQKIQGAVCLLIIFSAISTSVPFFIGKIIDIMYTSSDGDHQKMLSTLRTTCFTLSGVFFVAALANFGRLYMIQSAGQKITQRLRQRTFSAIISKEMSFFDRTSSGELSTRLSSDTILVGKAVTDNLSDGLRAIIQAIGGISLMFYTSTNLALISLTVVPPVVLFAAAYGRFVRGITKQVQNSLADSSQVAEERFGNMRTVRAFAQENAEMERYNKTAENIYNLSMKESMARAGFFALNGFSGNCIALLVLYNGGRMMADSLITVGDLTAFLMYTVYVGISISGVGNFYTELMKGLGASSRIWGIIDSEPEIPLSGGNSLNALQDQSVIFKSVGFTYPARPEAPILQNFELNVPSGSITAIVGESGSGKSTIASLLLRYYDVNKGSITIGGNDIQTLDPSLLRSYIGTVSQEPILFSTTIAENISYGANEETTFDDIIDAAKKANAYKFIMSFPDQFQTVVGERGQMLSGGQRQRIALARAIIKNPKVLLLDEATSALDAESESLVQDVLQKLMVDRTTVIIAHRLSTIKNAHQIAVLQDGKIAEVGAYGALIKKDNGLFRKLVEKQSFSS